MNGRIFGGRVGLDPPVTGLVFHGYDVKERLGLLELEQKLPYIHNMVGWNYRMTEMQSVIGLAGATGRTSQDPSSFQRADSSSCRACRRWL